MDNFGDRLRQLRGDRSQKQVAEELGMPQTTLSSLENQESVPRGEVLQKLASHFKVPLNYFYEPRQTGLTSTAAAKSFLQALKMPMKGRDTVAASSSNPLEDSVKQQIASRIKEQLAKPHND